MAMGIKSDAVLGIETSCDETAAAVVAMDGGIRAHVIASQVAAHTPHGGVVPEVAARAHLEHIDGVIGEAMRQAGCAWGDLSAIAATGGPGLIGGVVVGTVAAKAIASACGLPYYAINHLEGHALTPRLTALAEGGIAYPYLVLLVSGGHTQLLAVEGVGAYHRYGTTMDDAAGEAFDKTAMRLGLGLPGGAALEALAKDGDAMAYDLPRPLMGKAGCDFSFSGLKTAVVMAYDKHIATIKDSAAEAQAKADLAASLQAAIAESLAGRSLNAMRRFRDDYDYDDAMAEPVFVAAGGVAANATIRKHLTDLAAAEGFGFHAPPPHLCTDNGVMIAWAAVERIKAGLEGDGFDFDPRPRWPLDSMAASTERGRA